MAKTGKMRDSETGLTQREELFCQYIIADPSMDKATAFVKAGYAKKTANVNAYICFDRPDVQAYYNKLKAERAERLAVTADDVLRDLIEIKERCMQHKPVMYFDKVKKDYVQETVTVKHKDGTITEEGVWVFDANNSIKAIETLIKHFVTVPKDIGQSEIKEPEINTISNLDNENI